MAMKVIESFSHFTSLLRNVKHFFSVVGFLKLVLCGRLVNSRSSMFFDLMNKCWVNAAIRYLNTPFYVSWKLLNGKEFGSINFLKDKRKRKGKS